jgi:alpha-mannosidase
VRDHRLRVHFPTGIHATRAWADSAFDVLSRPVGVPLSQPDWKEQPVASWPLQHFVDVYDEDGGLMVATDGLPEYEVEQLERGCVIAITLLRCVGWLSRGDLFTRQGNAGPAVATPGAQCLGEHRFRYSLIPHRGSWENALKEAHGFASPMRAQVAWGCAPKSGTGSLVSVQPETVIVSAMKRPESGEGLLVRLYNPLTRDVSVRMNVESPFTSATRVNLREDPISEPGQSPQLELLTGGQLAFDLPAKRIQSILFR